MELSEAILNQKFGFRTVSLVTSVLCLAEKTASFAPEILAKNLIELFFNTFSEHMVSLFFHDRVRIWSAHFKQSRTFQKIHRKDSFPQLSAHGTTSRKTKGAWQNGCSEIWIQTLGSETGVLNLRARKGRKNQEDKIVPSRG